MTTTDNSVVLYQTPDGVTLLVVHLEKDTVWLTLNQASDLSRRDKSFISRWLHNVFREGELVRAAVVAKYAATAALMKKTQSLK